MRRFTVLCENIAPIPGKFIGEPKIFRPKLGDSGRLGDRHYCPWKGGPLYCSWYA